MKIKVRIVGVYFNKEVTIEDPNASVWDVTKAAASQSGGKLRIYEKIDERTKRIILDKVEHETDPTVEQSPSGVNRRSGTYSLSADSTIRCRALVWQYYINRKSGIFTGQEKKVELRVKISADNIAVPSTSARNLEDGDEVLWRLLAIGLDPIGSCSPPPKGNYA